MYTLYFLVNCFRCRLVDVEKNFRFVQQRSAFYFVSAIAHHIKKAGRCECVMCKSQTIAKQTCFM